MKTTIILLFILVPLAAANRGISATRWSPREDVGTLTTEERIVMVLRDSGFSRPMQRIILAQAKHESGGFKNSLTVYHNNVFAMLHPRQRRTLSMGPWAKAEGRGGYGSYASIEDATRDYILYCRFMNVQQKTDAKSYIYQLKRLWYFGDNRERYLRGVQYWMRQDSTVRNFSTN